MNNRVALFLAVLAALASPAAAQSRDEVFRNLWQDMNGALLGYIYNRPTSFSSSQVWHCITCDSDQRVGIGWFDWADVYETDDPAIAMRRIAERCQLDPCTTEPYQVEGLTGLIQYGTHPNSEAARTYVILGDRLWSLYVLGMPTADAARALVPRVDAALLPRILAAQP